MQSTNHRSAQAGVTLIELMIVVVIVAILASVAIPSYRNYVMRSQRSDAKEALLRLATAQEKFFLQNNRYAINDERDDAPPAGLGIPASDQGWYALVVEDPDDVAAATDGFTLTATAIEGGNQWQDTACRTFQVTDTGVRTARNAAGNDNTADCW